MACTDSLLHSHSKFPHRIIAIGLTFTAVGALACSGICQAGLFGRSLAFVAIPTFTLIGFKYS